MTTTLMPKGLPMARGPSLVPPEMNQDWRRETLERQIG